MELLFAILYIFSAWFFATLWIILLGDCDVMLHLAEQYGKSPRSLKNKVVWITGASSGIGEYLAYELAKVGCKLVLSARRLSELEKVKQECIKLRKLQPEDVMTIYLDMLEFDTHQSAVDDVISKFGKIDILVNNAGLAQLGVWHETTIEVDQQLLNVNVLGVISLTKCVLPHMIRRNEGHIVNTSGVAGKIGSFCGGTFAGTKYAIQGLFDSLELELIGTKISVTNVCPCQVQTNIGNNLFGERPGEEPTLIKYSTTHNISPKRCAKLYAIAISNKLTEVWICLNPMLFTVYLILYWPIIGNFVFRKCKIVGVTKKIN